MNDLKMRRFLTTLCLLILICPAALAQEEAPSAQAPLAEISLVQTLTDGNAMQLSFVVTPLSNEASLYGTLDKIYVNGFEAAIAKASARTFGWLAAPLSFTLTLDVSDLPPSEQYTVALSYSVLRPNGEVTIIASQTGDEYMDYENNITDLNDAGYVVSTSEGDILLARGTYEDDVLLSGQLEQAGKMTPLAPVTGVFTVPLNDIPVLRGAFAMDMGGWIMRAEKAEASELCIALIISEIFPETYTISDVTAAMRRIAVTDEAGNKSFYSGSQQQMSEVERQMDGTWLVTINWYSASVISVPTKLRVTPYTFDAHMSPVEDVNRAMVITLE